ncbi:MAG: 1-deoxy-D-xylulose-5-phosphate reductoisomerase [Clostridia bacterium]|nr:1-deoxy-D-xylulose-5-phosphate reductoisomerase [Clostridia bacterium]
MKKRSISVLGSTGSIGTQTLDVAARQGIPVAAIAAGQNVRLAEEQIRRFRPRIAAMGNEAAAKELRTLVADTGVKVLSGEEGVCEVAACKDAEIAVAAIVGTAGLKPVLAAINSGHEIALANKETLVCAGDIVNKLAAEKGVKLVPVDSEHSAIYRCIGRRPDDKPSRITLTASGGAFWGKTRDEMRNVSLSEALKHPNWSMGAKVTLDSASLVNKGLELMEAIQLFGLPEDKIDILVHPQSIIHSLIEFSDGALLAQLGVPDMRTPIAYALSGNGSGDAGVRRLRLSDYAGLTFFEPDENTYPALSLARKAAKRGGNAPAVFNAAAEEADGLFIGGKLGFTEITDLIGLALENVPFGNICGLDDVLNADGAAREFVKKQAKL